ncbi:MAG: preprotein translocase subunit SecG [Candidatus Paceibacteria bacterium]|jgi:preprotein translocase subunit SecG
MDLLQTLLFIIFVLSAIVLTVVILLQEGKGGGFGDALGTAGQQTFGVATKGIQSFTGFIAAVFLVSAISIHIVVRMTSTQSIVGDPGVAVPADSGGTSAPDPSGDGN